ncbi:MAG: aminotransferase class V-fold PLP-dependent enzyme, partial [Bacteroidota bacterium]
MIPFDVVRVRQDFPILQETVHGKPLIYFDNGASSQKPQQVIDRINHYYAKEHSNVHRGVHHLSAKATEAYEAARKTVADFIGATTEEIVFTKGTTDAINTVAFSFGETLKPGDEILITGMEHHSNIVPWQMLCERKSCVLKVLPVLENGTLDLSKLDQFLTEKTK